MAIPNNYIDKITKGNDSRDICPAADKVRVNNENFEGTDLDEVLDEVAQAIGEAGEGGGDPATAAPAMDGTAAVGTSLKYAREDHVHPKDTSKQDTLTFDNAPTAGSNNPVKSGGIKTAIDAVTPTIDPTTKKWVVGGQLTNVVAEGQDGNSGVASADGVASVNNLNGGTTDTAERVYVLGANQGKVIKDILDKTYRSASTGETSTIIVEQEVQMKAGTGEGTLGATIVVGQRRPGTGGMDVVNATNGAQHNRRTVNRYFTRKGDNADCPFPDEFTVSLPSGFSVGIVGSDVLNTNGSNDGVWDTGWLTDGDEVDLMGNSPLLPSLAGDKNYIAINFKKGDNAYFSNDDLASLISNFALVWTEEVEQEVVGPAAGKAMEFINANGQVAKTVYCKDDNSAKVQVYTKEAVDDKIASECDAVAAIDYDVNFRSVAHRGLMSVAPENTIPAYRAARAAGFRYAETDVAFTSDGVPVLLHDESINRTSNGTGNLASLTYSQVRQYDFGSWFSSDFAGTQIPSFEEFLVFCKQVGLHPYIEMKSATTYTQAQIESLVDMVEAVGMKGKVTWISFSSTYLGYVKNYDATARLGFLLFDEVTDANITTVNGLKTSTNEVFLDTRGISSDVVSKAESAHIPLETWKPAATTGDWTISDLLSCDPYFSGITTNAIIGGKLLYENAMNPS